MAYPVKLFDFTTPEGERVGRLFLSRLDEELTNRWAITERSEHIKKYVSWSQTQDVPQFLKDLATQALLKVINQLPGGELKWQGSMGLYGRKDGSVIKRRDDIVYRLVINVGSTEVYYVTGNGHNEPVAVPNGYALICSPQIISQADIKVNANPMRKNLPKEMSQFVEKIRLKDYMRLTVVLDLPLDGLEFPEPTENDLEHDTNENSEHEQHTHVHSDSCNH